MTSDLRPVCRVVGGMEVLSAMEAVETDEEDRPREEIKICRASIFVDPFKEAEEEVCTVVCSDPVYFSISVSCWQRRRGRGMSSPAPVAWWVLFRTCVCVVTVFSGEEGGKAKSLPQWSWQVYSQDPSWREREKA